MTSLRTLLYGLSTIVLSFAKPECKQVDHVKSLIGSAGDSPNGSGGMIPSTAPPFAMTRWVAQTRANYVSVTPYNITDNSVHGFQGTHQPAIWMGESGNVAIVPGSGADPTADFESRGMAFVDKNAQIITPSYYSVELALNESGTVLAEQSATSRVGHLGFTFSNTNDPYVLVEASRPSVITSTATNITYPDGSISIFPDSREICGWNSERQDWIITPISGAENANNFKGYFCARFDQDFDDFGILQNKTRTMQSTGPADGPLVSGYAKFQANSKVDVRVGVSFISIEQARKNLEAEIPDGTDLQSTAETTKQAWAEKLCRINIEGASEEEADVFYTAVFHSLQYPYEQHEDGHYYSAYDNTVHAGESYTGYSIWDTYRAEWAWLILMAPERLPSMVSSMLQDYQQSGWLPMWKNIAETNIMVGTHADSQVSEAVIKGVKGFDTDLAWEAVHKDGTVPPQRDNSTVYADREENVDYEVRAGLSSVYSQKGWVADDIHSESGSRTLDYAYDDYAIAMLAKALNKDSKTIDFFLNRSLSAPFSIFNSETGFMEARNASGEWAGEDQGWTEGDMWAYSFDVVHDIPALIEKRGGNESFVKSLDEHFDGGHNDHSNEPSHHIPYLYAMAGAAYKTQAKVREIAKAEYNNTPNGLAGNEDCGQMSAWYIFSALGWYPVNPVSGEYVIGTPFFDKMSIDLPDGQSLKIAAAGASSDQIYVKSVTINGEPLETPILRHEQFANGGENVNIVFEMAAEPQVWGRQEKNVRFRSYNAFPEDVRIEL